MIIYKATNIINNKIYIGATKYTLEQRKKGHIKHANSKNKPKGYFQKAIIKYGEENFKWEVIDNALTYEELMEKEKYWIKYYNSFGENGYNMCEGGGNTSGYRFSEESKNKIREKAKINNSLNNPFKGKTHSQELKDKWSKERKGRKLEGEWLKNIQKVRKKNCKKVINLDTGEIFNSIGEAQEKYGLKNGIANVCRGKKKTAAKCRWKFYEDYVKQQS